MTNPPPWAESSWFYGIRPRTEGSWTIRVKTSHWFPMLVDIQIPAATPATRLNHRDVQKLKELISPNLRTSVN